MVYVHVPFCKSFCIYCDFYSDLHCESAERYVECVEKEAKERHDEILAASQVKTLYFGGGTPSVLPPAFLGRILKALPTCEYEEFTVEVNPDDISKEYVRSLLDLGVSRISMGVQSTDDALLAWMRRRHDSKKALEAYRTLRNEGVGNISLDLIFGISGMRDGSLEKTLDDFLLLRPEHISAYQLSIEDGSALGALARKGKYTELPDEQCAAQYSLICRRLSQAGYEHYEISNWALPGFRAKHNSAYWTRAPYVGLGPGAHSLLPGNVRMWNSQTPYLWKEAGREVLTAKEVREEEIMLGLRTAEGAVIDGRRVVIPESDWFVSDTIIRDYL